MQVTINMDSEQIISAASNMSIDEKLKLYDSIKVDIFKYRFNSLLSTFKTDALSEKDILEEVENVRTERYKTSH